MSTSVSISSITLSAPASYVTFSVIPQSYTDLIVVINGYLNSADGSVPRCRFNYDSGSNYSTTILTGTGTTPKSSRTISQTNLWIGSNDVGWSTNSSNMSTNILQIMNYSNDKIYKSTLLRLGQTGGSYPGVEVSTGLWASLLPINSISIMAQASLSGEFATGTTFNLYGINSANSGQAKATGGDTIIRDASYWYHVFNKSGTFTPTQNLTADYLVIAGGGSGGADGGGGGGAGGYRSQTSQALSASNPYQVLVGAGAPGVSTSTIGNKGSDSSFNSLISEGGGYGGKSSAGGNGGSGGGGSATGYSSGTFLGGSATSGHGNNGGNGFATSNQSGNAQAGGGGGGAGAVGGNGADAVGGNGGAGSNAHSTWASATGTGVSGYYAGGGGGATRGSGTTYGTGGSGGGGNASFASPISGTTNTGSGGGGQGYSASNNYLSGSGGSGIVIVRYPV